MMTPAAFAAPKFKLMVYTSMKETLIGEIRDSFVKKYPKIQFDYYSAGAGKLMAKIAAERQSGKLAVDVLWTSEIPDFYQLKQQKLLKKYKSPQAKYVVSPVMDPDWEFTPARLGTLGIAYNTAKVKAAPKSWQDLLDKQYADSFGIANPALSGTAMVSIAMLKKTFGWELFNKFRVNGAKMGQGSGQVVDDTASGDLKACIGVDYITLDKIKKGATLGFVYPKEMLIVPSPVAIFKETRNFKAAKIFVDFLLSKEGQRIIANNYTLPVRRDVPVAKKEGMIEVDEAVQRAIPMDYLQMLAEKESIIEKFTNIMLK
ncbi:MAG TPA: ABC transporter substrate-binding protein [Bacillota bacterium]|nr:ABC transporter substrate-binding protein [Bacillota bacterium]